MSGPIVSVAVAVAAIGLVSTSLWFGVSRRREAEVELGIQALANMKWRDCIDVILEALQREGYGRKIEPAAAGGGNDLLLDHGNEIVLLSYKHGTAYRLGEANIREFVNAVQLRGARRGLLLTLGSAEPGVEAIAKSAGVQMFDGRSLWLMLRPLMPPAVLELVRSQATARIRNGLWAGFVGSLVAGAAVYVLGSMLPTSQPGSPALTPAATVAAQPVGAVPAGRSDDAMLKQLNATAEAMAEIARLPSAEIARRRAQAAKEISLMAQVNTAVWTAPSRLLITLNHTDGKDKALIDEMCRLIIQYEELRYTRVQMEPPIDSNLPVRWRLCE
jgi:hypothetical protein